MGAALRSRGAWSKIAMALGGLLVWSVHFGFVYGASSLACGRGWTTARILGVHPVPLAIGAATLLALGATLWLAVMASRPSRADRTDRFLRASTVLIASLAGVAILFGGMPALFLPMCG